MKGSFIPLLVFYCLFFITETDAQKQYILNHFVGQYETIRNGLIISAPDSNEDYWDENGFVFQFEQPFSFPDIPTPYTGGIVTTNGEVVLLGDPTAVTRIMSPLYLDLVDKRIYGAGQTSEIVLKHENNITKIEWLDASTFCSVIGVRETEGITFAVWFYHNTGVFEYRYGTNTLSPETESCLFSGLDDVPDISFLDLSPSFQFLKAYVVTGDPLDPDLILYNSEPIGEGISSIPPDGLIYRFVYEEPSSARLRENALNVQVSPNPFNEILRIDTDVIAPMQVLIHSMDGKVVYSNNAIENKEINVKALSPGFYIAEIKAAGQSTRVKLVKH
jgi:hypothetical protein